MQEPTDDVVDISRREPPELPRRGRESAPLPPAGRPGPPPRATSSPSGRVRSPGRAANRTSSSSSPTTSAGPTCPATARRRSAPRTWIGSPPGRAVHRRLLGVFGVLPDAVRALHRALSRSHCTAACAEPIGGPTPVDGIPLDHPTLASLLKGAGYDTAMLGKWHCGYLPWFSPTRLGWDEFFGNFAGGSRLLLQDQLQRRLRPLRGRGRAPGPALLHARAHRAGHRVRVAAARAAVAAEPQLHDPALAVGGPRTTRRSATTSPRGSTTARSGAPRHTGRRLAERLPGDGRGPRRCRRRRSSMPLTAAGSSRTPSSSSPATTAANGSPTRGRSPAESSPSTRAASASRPS